MRKENGFLEKTGGRIREIPNSKFQVPSSKETTRDLELGAWNLGLGIWGLGLEIWDFLFYLLPGLLKKINKEYVAIVPPFTLFFTLSKFL